MQEARSATISSNMTSKRPSGTLETDRKPKLMDSLREALRSRHYSRRTEQTYCHWVKRFIFFHKVRHPAEMAEPEINDFLTHLAVKEKVSASTQNQALSALLFLYRHVIGREVGDLGKVFLMDRLDLAQMFLKRFLKQFRKHRYPVFRSFAVTDKNFVSGKINVLNPKPQAFHQAQPRAVHKRGHQPLVFRKVRQYGFHFIAGHNHWQACWLAGTDDLLADIADFATDHVAIEEQQG